MSPWLLVVLLLLPSGQYQTMFMEVPTLRACEIAQAAIRERIDQPALMGCYQLANGI